MLSIRKFLAIAICICLLFDLLIAAIPVRATTGEAVIKATDGRWQAVDLRISFNFYFRQTCHYRQTPKWPFHDFILRH